MRVIRRRLSWCNGRRRVGKTALISRFIADKPAIYYLATEESEPQNRAVFQSLVADYLHDDLLRDALLPRWSPVFTAIARSAAEARSNGRRLVIVLDEFQYLWVWRIPSSRPFSSGSGTPSLPRPTSWSFFAARWCP